MFFIINSTVFRIIYLLISKESSMLINANMLIKTQLTYYYDTQQISAGDLNVYQVSGYCSNCSNSTKVVLVKFTAVN